VLAGLALCAAGAAGLEFSGTAFVNTDGSLRLRGHTVHLAGVLWLDTIEDCRRHERPLVCGPRATLALDQAIQGFVRCTVEARRPDGSYEAHCTTRDGGFRDREIDLAAYLLTRGWVAAAPEAPARYQVMERAARRQGLGLWGTPLVIEP
jgi:endonuclease YncB( thermonuclease family)